MLDHSKTGRYLLPPAPFSWASEAGLQSTVQPGQPLQRPGPPKYWPDFRIANTDPNDAYHPPNSASCNTPLNTAPLPRYHTLPLSGVLTLLGPGLSGKENINCGSLFFGSPSTCFSTNLLEISCFKRLVLSLDPSPTVYPEGHEAAYEGKRLLSRDNFWDER